METTTLIPEDPRNAVKFYLALPCSILEARDNNTLSFRLPANKAFPLNLRPIIKKIKRVFSYEKSDIVGRAGQTIVCQGLSCIGYASPNPITYTMKPLYPPFSRFLAELKPKIGFVMYVPIMMTTMPPSTTSRPPIFDNIAIFSITYNSFSRFNTPESFTRLYNSVVENQQYLMLINQPQYAEHNMATLQMLQKKNKIPASPSLTMRPQKQQQPKPQQQQQQQKPKQTIERYENEEDITLEDVSVPVTEEDSTEDETMVVFATLEPEFEETGLLQEETTNEDKNKKIWMGVAGVVVVALFLKWYFSGGKKPKGRKKKTQQQQ